MRNLVLMFAGMMLSAAVAGFAHSAEIRVGSVLISVIDTAEVPARDAGVLTEILVREGEEVEQGTLLVKLDPDEAELNLLRARQQLAIAELEYQNRIRREFARKSAEVTLAELNRSEAANRKFPESVSQTELDRLRLVAEKSALDVEQAEHEHQILGLTVELRKIEVDEARFVLERRLIRAPLSGTVTRISHRPGEWVQPGLTIVKIISTRRLRAEAVLPGRYRGLDLLQAAVAIEVPGSEAATPAVLPGLVTFVHPEIDPVDGSFRIWAEIDNPEQQLRPGDSVTMRIQSDSAQAVNSR